MIRFYLLLCQNETVTVLINHTANLTNHTANLTQKQPKLIGNHPDIPDYLTGYHPDHKRA